MGGVRDFRILRHFELDQRGGLLGSVADHVRTQSGHALLDIGQRERFDHFLIQPEHDFARRLSLDHRAVPRAHLIAGYSGFRDGRHIG